MTKAILAGVSAIAMLAISNGASAQVYQPTLDAGGGTLAAKLYRDIFNCYSTNAKTATGITKDFFSTSATAAEYQAAYGTTGTPAITYPKTLPSQCNSTYYNPAHTEAVDYLPVGSGAGLAAFEADTPTWGLPAVANPVAWLNDHLNIRTLANAEVEFDFSGSDAGLNSTSVASAAAHGTVIQFPSLATPIDLEYNTTTGGKSVKLETKDICGIFGGTITNWSQVSGSAGTNTGAITVVVRADGSGTSYIFSNYLAQVCPVTTGAPSAGFTAANGFPSTKPSWSAAAVANGGSFAGFVSESGSGGVATEINTTGDTLGYISPDYVGKGNGYSNTAAAQVQYPASGTAAKYVAPSTNGVLALLGGVPAPGAGDTNPLDYGQSLNDAAIAQDKMASGYPLHAYPIAGYTFIDTYACPANPTGVKNLFSWYFDSSAGQGFPFVSAVLKARGFAPVTTGLQGAINSNLIPEFCA